MPDSPIRVLLVEDSSIQTRFIQGVLANSKHAAFSLECTTRLVDGLTRLAQGGIDLVLLDLGLPESDGLQTFRRMRRAATVPIVVLTGHDDQMTAVTAVQEGAEDFLIKGQVDPETLSRSLRFAIERFRRRQAEWMLEAAQQEFRAARAIQEKLFPLVPQLASYDIGGTSYCAAGTCGDYFDYIRMIDGSVGIVVADVSGHGLGPALLMASTRAYFRALTRTHTDVGELLTAVNQILVDDTRTEHFVTLIFARLNPRTRTIVYGNAGHPAGYVLDRDGGIRSQLDSDGPPLGLMPEAVYQTSEEITLDPGDAVALLSDGILDATAPDGTAFGVQRALDHIQSRRQESALQIVESLYQATRLFSGDGPQDDDITAVVLKVEAQSSAENA